MTEADWLAATDPDSMLAFLHDRGGVGERKLRLFAVGCCRRVWQMLTDERSRQAVEVAEQFADGAVTLEELRQAHAAAGWAADDAFESAIPEDLPDEMICWAHEVGSDAGAAAHAAHRASATRTADVGAVIDDAARGVAHVASPLRLDAIRWDDSPARQAAKARDRGAQADLLRDLFGNAFRPAPAVNPAWLAWGGCTVPKLAAAIYEERAFNRLPILADALEDAGCTDTAVLGHCRTGGDHVRGCWVVDLILGKA
jgi:hypothetical protein